MPNFYAVFVDRALRGLRHIIPEFAGIRPWQRVLDVCCGTGDQAVHLARKGVEAFGIDLDPVMIGVAEARKKRYGKDNLHFEIADATALPFQDSFFDCAIISLALHEKPFEVEMKVVDEMRRVVKRGGSLVLADFPAPAGRFIRFIERLVGGEHYACFKSYQTGGGLDTLTEKMCLKIENRGAARGGMVQLLRIRN